MILGIDLGRFYPERSAPAPHVRHGDEFPGRYRSAVLGALNCGASIIGPRAHGCLRGLGPPAGPCGPWWKREEATGTRKDNHGEQAERFVSRGFRD